MRVVIVFVAAFFCTLAAPRHALAYCIYNELKDRAVAAKQDPHPEGLRETNVLKTSVKPGASACCAYKNLDCNPGGKPLSVVDFSLTVEGDPVYVCGVPRGKEPGRVVKIPGDGTVRIQPNPRFDPTVKDAALGTPFVVRIWGPDGKDIAGPTGLPCRP
jgi:hypothetical protein